MLYKIVYFLLYGELTKLGTDNLNTWMTTMDRAMLVGLGTIIFLIIGYYFIPYSRIKGRYYFWLFFVIDICVNTIYTIYLSIKKLAILDTIDITSMIFMFVINHFIVNALVYIIIITILNEIGVFKEKIYITRIFDKRSF